MQFSSVVHNPLTENSSIIVYVTKLQYYSKVAPGHLCIFPEKVFKYAATFSHRGAELARIRRAPRERTF